MSGFYKTFLIAVVGLAVALLALAFAFQYGVKYLKGLGSAGAGSGAGLSMQTILIILTIVSVIIWSVVTYVRPTGFKSLEPVKGNLEKESVIGGSNDLVRGFYGGNGGGSFGVYLYLTNYERTAMVGAGSRAPLVRIGGTRLYVNNNNDGYTTYFEIDTKDRTGAASKEIIPLEDFPTQKWVYLTVNREGRRFTAYYNGVVAGTKVTDSMYVVRPDALRIGAPSYRGGYAYPNINPSIMREADIAAYMAETSDTKHAPILPRDFWATISSGGIFCKDGEGIFCGSSTIQTPSGLKWDTQFG
jgi:hypothetical protein